MPEFITVAKVADIPSGEARAYECGDRLVAVFNQNGTFRAIDDMCPHMGASLASGHFDCDSGIVTCPWHAWSFDTKDGTWCDNRRLKTDVFEVRVVGDDIQVAPLENQSNGLDAQDAQDVQDSRDNQAPCDNNDSQSSKGHE